MSAIATPAPSQLKNVLGGRVVESESEDDDAIPRKRSR
jgi:hypothetical protein